MDTVAELFGLPPPHTQPSEDRVEGNWCHKFKVDVRESDFGTDNLYSCWWTPISLAQLCIVSLWQKNRFPDEVFDLLKQKSHTWKYQVFRSFYIHEYVRDRDRSDDVDPTCYTVVHKKQKVK